METYIFKIVLCSSLFILFYNLVLKNEKLLKFNRFYLIATLLISLAIPFLHYEIASVEVQKISGLQFGESENTIQNIAIKNSIFTFQNVIFTLYFLIIFFLLIKFLLNLWQINREISSNEKVKNGAFWLILKNEKTAPHSFWKYIFINKNDFQKGNINEKIILHETAHLEQKHSLDLLFIELFLIFFWFNPAFYLYKKAILTNHEYLADDLVLSKSGNVSEYQNLLLTQLISEKIFFSNSFNLINTKNRIKMMTKTLSKTAKLKSWMSIPLVAIAFFTFAEKIPAKEISIKSTREISLNKIDFINETKIHYLKREKDTIKKDTLKPMKQILEKKPEIAPPVPPVKIKTKDKIESPVAPPLPPIADKIDESAEFPGGINALRTQVANTFDISKMSGNEGLIKSTIYFKIDEKGVASNFRAEGTNEIFNAEAIRDLKFVNDGKIWKPAILDGKPVASVYKLPLTMKFEFAQQSK
ncbi:BlaR1 peptidase M56 [Halpernia humi]|uniref:BlaR1 peptidase M56 n=1 Tax=Halpernia humi TaxID=493375 RepID=A0A1H5WMF2_9FLAO|nr:M56 family metallopeptidase [Halpernia humi]SEG00440.1 BlaR1 peptidase M56 [Halpernia humi]